MKLTLHPDGSRSAHALHFDRDGDAHWHLAARWGVDGAAWHHPHWAKVAGIIFPGWRPRTFKVYGRGVVELWAWQFRKRDGWKWRHAATKDATGWARATISPQSKKTPHRSG